MRFRKGEHYPHPPRGSARRPYHVSDAARRARGLNLSKTRIRSSQEILTIKLWIWQDTFGDGPHLSQRELARQLGVYPSYIHKVQHQGAEAIDALTRGPRVAMDDLLAARHFSARLREQQPGLLRAVHCSRSEKARVLTDDEMIAETWRTVREEQRSRLSWVGRRVQFTVPFRW